MTPRIATVEEILAAARQRGPDDLRCPVCETVTSCERDFERGPGHWTCSICTSRIRTCGGGLIAEVA